jgi:pantoate--beta-alanine ligase
MKVTGTVSEVKTWLSENLLAPKGFVPTMGALHEGHISLVKTAISFCPAVAVSIFVNPTQFNDKEDLKNYPRTIGKDLEMLKKAMRTDDLVFIPTVEEIYPTEETRIFDFGSLTTIMEGLHRPGHFNGVAQVVSRLFEIIEPDIAFFGQKDFQQLAVVKELVRQTGNRVNIIGCPIVREEDGLAMSSRNRLLEPGIRENAPVIFRALTTASEMAKTSEIRKIKNYVESEINSTPGFSIEYFEIVDEKSLTPLESRSQISNGVKYFGCIAVKAGKIRLIDNLEISLV